MTRIFKKECQEAVLSFDVSFRAMGLSQEEHFSALQLLDSIKDDALNPTVEGVALACRIRSFYDCFSRELLPGGIILSQEARKDFNRISDLANSSDLLKKVHIPIKIFW